MQQEVERVEVGQLEAFDVTGNDTVEVGTHAIQRELLTLENQGGDKFFGEPMLDIADLMQTQAVDGKMHGVVNILAADKRMHSPKTKPTLLQWMLEELFEHLSGVVDPE